MSVLVDTRAIRTPYQPIEESALIGAGNILTPNALILLVP